MGYTGRFIDRAKLQELADAGLTSDQIAEATNFSRMSVTNAASRWKIKIYSRKYKKVNITRLKELAHAGLTQAEIAREMGHHPTAIAIQANLHGIEVFRRRMGHKDEDTTLASMLTAPDPNPPSAAMVRLAEFDPVVARALRVRQGLIQKEEEGDEPSS